MNQVSIKAKKENLLRTKTKGYKDNIKQSQFRVKSKSSLHNLAGTLYSDRKNKGFSPQKTASGVHVQRNASTSRLSKVQTQKNPENLAFSLIMNKTLTALEQRASHIPGLADINTQLLKDKKDLQARIANLKQKIVKEKKGLNNAQYNCKKNRNQRDHNQGCYNEAHTKSQRLNEQIDLTTHDNNVLKSELRKLRQNINDRKDNIKIQRKNCEQLDNNCKNLKTNLMQTERERNQVKADLAKDQRVMNSASIYSHQLEEQRAMLLLQINQSVNDYKL